MRNILKLQYKLDRCENELIYVHMYLCTRSLGENKTKKEQFTIFLHKSAQNLLILN